jgi:hypothetical protein
MKYILVIWKTPNPKDRNLLTVNQWNAARDGVLHTLQPTSGSEELAEGVFLIRANSGLPTLGASISLAGQAAIPYRVLFVESGEEWSCAPTKPGGV